jgi:DNA-binding transcriptional LysR family regulator
MDQFNLLRLIIAIADRGSLVGAAKSLSISPASATLGLQRLEDQAGGKLITRSTRTLLLTAEGERFVADARRIVGDLHEAFEAVSEQGALRGAIRLTATHDFGRTRLVPLIDAFMKNNPGVHCSLSLSDGVVDLVAGRFDFAVRISGASIEDRPGVHLLRRGNRRVCASPSYWARNGKPQHPRDLQNHTCLFVTRPESSESSWSFSENGKTFHVRVEGDRTADDGSAVRAWAVSGAGVIFNASFDVADDIADGRLEAVLEDYTTQEVNLYTVLVRKGGASRRVLALIDFINENL